MASFFERIRGYKTLATGAFLVTYALAGAAGIDVPSPDGEQALVVSGALMIMLRFATSGRVGGS